MMREESERFHASYHKKYPSAAKGFCVDCGGALPHGRLYYRKRVCFAGLVCPVKGRRKSYSAKPPTGCKYQQSMTC
jgi:hypothetical protein